MSGNESDDVRSALETGVDATASSTYKVLGELSADSGTGVLGKNTASSGTPIGVEGAVPNSSAGYGLSTPDDARVAGTAHVAAIGFADTSGETGAFAVAEASDGNLEVSNGSSPTHEFTATGDANVTGSFTENASL